MRCGRLLITYLPLRWKSVHYVSKVCCLVQNILFSDIVWPAPFWHADSCNRRWTGQMQYDPPQKNKSHNFCITFSLDGRQDRRSKAHRRDGHPQRRHVQVGTGYKPFPEFIRVLQPGDETQHTPFISESIIPHCIPSSTASSSTRQPVTGLHRRPDGPQPLHRRRRRKYLDSPRLAWGDLIPGYCGRKARI